jgi:hypothetical protein
MLVVVELDVTRLLTQLLLIGSYRIIADWHTREDDHAAHKTTGIQSADSLIDHIEINKKDKTL